MCGYKCNNDLRFLYRLARGSRTAIKVAMSRSGDRAADNSCNTDNDNSSSASPSSERKSGDFSISAILSDDTGGSSSRRKRGPTARERRSSSGAVVSPPAAVDRTPHHMQQTGVSSFECLHNGGFMYCHWVFVYGACGCFLYLLETQQVAHFSLF